MCIDSDVNIDPYGIVLFSLRYYYNKVTRTSKWRMPDEAKVMLDLNPIWLACEKETISHASDFRSISVVKTLSPGADGLLVLAHGAKSSPIDMSPDANLPTIVASESSSLSGKVSSPMIEIVKMKNSSEPSSIVVASSEKIGIAVTLGNSLAPPVSETTTTQDAVVYGDGFSSENREMLIQQFCSAVVSQMLIGEEYAPNSNEEAKSAFKTLLEYANIGSDCTWDQEHAKALEEQKHNRVECLEFLKSHDFIKEYIRDLESEWEKKRKLWMEELRKAEHKNHDEFRKLMEEHVATGILNAKTNRRDYCIKIKSFVAYLAVSSNTSGSTGKDLYTDVMDELEK
ncbi:Pre-mRNA-processing protein 40A [Capsicum baccatum]|uniref:Pre-mRNA-processing protein 40A n=1 Tax=Capsicum baccatum TaxID=33114 RepID=A0A2G2V9B1_CAPBA|nr:Pre-mRNA-processing protein 40A [Capsicum baccatum]